MKTISIKLPEPLLEDLARRARSGAASQSEIVRKALAAYLQSEPAPQPASCAERAARWAGMVEGPADLSTDPRHLRGFGK